jgi:hypothetical protein
MSRPSDQNASPRCHQIVARIAVNANAGKAIATGPRIRRVCPLELHFIDDLMVKTL